jgi:predicted DCC family thiol-disulfide oxidoreductase YuxK
MNLLQGITTLSLLLSVIGFQAKPMRVSRRNSIEQTQHSATVETELNSPELYDAATISSRVFGTDRRPVILFDGVCNMCNSAVNLSLDWDKGGKLRFAALQSNVGRALLAANGRSADDISSIVLVTSDGAYVKSDAILKITEELTPFSLLPLKPAAALARLVVPKILRDVIYDGVADNRYSVMGKRDECRLDSDGEFENRFVDDRIAVKV